jgi:hypothetical protein
LQNQRVRRQPLDEEKLADLDLDNADFDDNFILPDFTMDTETIDNEDAIFRQEAQETGGEALDLTFENTMELWLDTLRNSSWVKNMNNNLRTLGRLSLNHQEVIQAMNQKIIPTDYPLETTTQKYVEFPVINSKVNLLLNTLKLLQTKFNIDFNSRVQVGDFYLYVSDSKINEEINHIFIQLNMIKLSNPLSLPYQDFFEKELGMTSRKSIEALKMTQPEKVEKKYFSQVQLENAFISALMVIFVFLPFYIYFNCK